MITKFCFLLISAFLASPVVSEKPLAVVVWHGIGVSGNDSIIRHRCQLIRDEIPGVYVLNLEIGPPGFFDRLNSFFMPVWQQLDVVCETVHSDPQLADGFHLVGFSQGGLLVRALAQRCPPKRLGSVISIGGPQQGVYGLSFCFNVSAFPQCDLLRRYLSKIAYIDDFQSRLVPAQYWHDPMKEARYRAKSQFLAEFNQERAFNPSYRENLLMADNLVLVRFMNDTTVIPNISEWFGFYRSGSSEDTYDYKESRQYQEDTLGLQTLDKQGRLHFLSLPGSHDQFSDEWFRTSIIRKFLKVNKG
ncbi:hypothetical protein Aperf_G00000014837 [Anoplocephala perfoliata]